MEWHEYNGEEPKDLSTSNACKIVSRLGKICNDIFREEREIKTRLIKKNLIILGLDLGYISYANNLKGEDLTEIKHPYVQRELLYDLIWCTEDECFLMNCMELAVECEWSQRWKSKRRLEWDSTWKLRETSFSGFKYDFQKLLVCNAVLRLMIFRIKKRADLDELEEYFDKAIQSYTLLNMGATFLFLAFFEKEEKLYYKEIVKGSIVSAGHYI